MKSRNFQCCFCGEKIENSGLDVSSLILLTNWENKKKQREQQFFCHIKCFQKTLHDNVPLYVLDLEDIEE